jgi:hypothetical protein
MATTLLALRKDADRDAFTARLDAAGVEWEPVAGLPRHFVIHGVAPDDFPLASDPDILAIDDGNAEVRGASSQELAINASLGGASWAIARAIRRSAPWNVDRISLPFTTYYRCVRDGSGVDYYSIDTGIRLTHDEFGSRATNVYEYFSSGGAGDNNGHGSATSAAACGSTSGFARASLLWSFKGLTLDNIGDNNSVLAALGQALTHYSGRSGTGRPAVVNLALAGFSSTLNEAVSDMIDAGMVVVAAAGNAMKDLGTINQYPAESDADVVIVGGVGMADIPYYSGAFGTDYGSEVDIVAPSQTIRTAWATSDSTFILLEGTSMGASLTAGVVACMLQGHARLTGRSQVQAVKAQLLANATTGKFRAQAQFNIGTLPDRILYLDPDQTAPGPIAGL